MRIKRFIIAGSIACATLGTVGVHAGQGHGGETTAQRPQGSRAFEVAPTRFEAPQPVSEPRFAVSTGEAGASAVVGDTTWVAWASTISDAVVLSRLGPEGELLDPLGIPVSQARTTIPPDVYSDGRTLLVTLGGGILGVVLDERATPLGPPIRLSPYPPATYSAIAVAAGREGYAVLAANGGTLTAIVLDSTGRVAHQTVIGAVSTVAFPRVVFTGEDFLAVWITGANYDQLQTARIATDGTVTLAPPLPLERRFSGLTAVWNGSELAVFSGATDHALIDLFLTIDGKVVSGPQTVLPNATFGYFYELSADWNGSEYAVAYTDAYPQTGTLGPGTELLYVIPVAPSGAALGPVQEVSQGPPNLWDPAEERSSVFSHPSLHWNGSHFILTWSEVPAGVGDPVVRDSILSDDGSPLQMSSGRSGVAVSRAATFQTSPVIARSSAATLVIWREGSEENHSIETRYRIFGDSVALLPS